MLKRSLLFFLLLAFMSAFFLRAEEGSPDFYLSTDKSFAKDEVPYVNLEGPGYSQYNLRIYQIADPESFLLTKVKERLVKESNDSPAFANPISLFKNTLQYFKNDLRKIARKELNSKTRSNIVKGLKLEFKPVQEENPALFPILKEHKLLLSFAVPTANQYWLYKRVPVPLKDNGVFLVEAIRGSHVAYSLVLKSDIHFVTKLSDSETLIYSAKKDTGAPISDASVKIWEGNSGEEIYSGKTNSSGILHFNGKTNTKSLILISSNGQYALSDPNFYATSFYGEGGVKSYLYTDRPVYRPGDTIYFKGIVRNFKKDSYFPVSGEGTVDVFTSKGDPIYTGINVSVSENTGTFNGEFKAPEGEEVFLGVYNLVLNYENKSYSTEFSVDAYKKPPFLVKVKQEKPSYVKGEKVKFEITARYYHGKPVSGGKLQYQIFRKAKYDYSPVGKIDWEGGDAYFTEKDLSGKREVILSEEATLDRNGSFTSSFIPQDISEDFSYTIIATVLDSDISLSGAANFSVNRSSILIRVKKENQLFEPGSQTVVTAELIPYDKTLSKEGKTGEIGNRKIKATLFRRKFANISSEAERKRIDSIKEKTDDSGKANFTFKIPEKGHYILRFETEDSHGSETFSETALWSSAKSDSIEIPIKDITLLPGKDIYSPGETAEIMVLSPVADASVLITLEGNRILKYESVPMKGNSMKYSVKISPELSPNFTLSAVLFANKQTYSGQVKVVAPPEDKFLKVKVKTDKDEYRPGETVQLEINTSDLKSKGLPTEVSISIVDEAIYQIQEDKNPPLISYFYHPRRNNVNTVYSSSYRFFGYSEAKRMELALGKKTNLPLTALKEDDNRSRERFKDTAFWNANVETDENGKAKLNFVLPDNLTSWRISAVALTSDSKFGQTTSNFISRKSMTVQANVPSFVVRGEKQNVSTTVTNFTKGKENITVNLSISGGTIIGEKTKKVTLDGNASALVNFTIETPKDANAKEVALNFTAKGTYQDSESKKVPLKDFGMEKIESVSLKVSSSEKNAKATIKLPETGTKESLMLRLNPGSLEALRSSLPYLIEYPYGCVEQTMSRFVPILAAEQAGAVSVKVKQELPLMARQGLANLKRLQGKEGGFLWFGEGNEDALMTAYVYRSLAIAKKLKENPDDSMMNRTRSYLYKALTDNSDPFVKAYILFSLTEESPVELSMADSLAPNLEKQSVYGKALTGLVFHSLGKEDKAKESFKKANEQYQKNKTSFDATLEKDRVETLAGLVLLAVRLGEESSAESLAQELIQEKTGFAWKNSRDTGMAVLALSEKISRFKEKIEPLTLTVKWNDNEIKSFKIKGSDILSGKSDFSLPITDIKKGNNTIELKQENGSTIFATLLLRYTDTSPSFKAESAGISVKREYFSVKAEEDKGKMKLTSKPASSFKQGELVMVSLELERSGKEDSYFMVEDPILPGFSFVKNDSNYFTSNSEMEYDSRQIYDDRAVFFARGPAKKITVRYFLRADITGEYKASPAAASLMYYPEIRGSSASGNLKVE